MSRFTCAWQLLLPPLLMAVASPALPQQAGSVPAPRVTAEDFAAFPFFSDPKISPDGRRIAAQATIEGVSTLLVADVSGGDFAPTKVPLPKDVHLLWTRWAGGKVLMSLAMPSELFGVKFHTSRVLSYDPGTKALAWLAPNVRTIDADNVIHIDPAGKFILLSAGKAIFDYPSVWRVELDSSDVTEVVKAQPYVWSWFADPQGIVRAGLGIDGNRWWLLYRTQRESKFRRVIKESLSQRKKEEERTQVERFIPVGASDQGYAVADKGTGRFGIYRYDFAADKLGDPIFEHPQVDVESFSLSKAGEIEAIHYIDERDRVVWVDPEMKKLQAQVDRVFPSSVNHILSHDDSRRRLIVETSAPDDPGTYFLFEADKRKMHRIARPYEALEGKALAKVEPVRYRARDGLEIPAYLTLPRGRSARNLPLILMPHGGPFLRDKWAYEPWVQFLANRGYAVLQPNFRGSTGYGKAFLEAGAGQWGRKMQDDLDDGVRWLSSQGTIDAKRVCIVGASYGGYAAMWAAARNPEIYRCAVSFAGISDVKAMVSYSRRLFVAPRYHRDWRDRVRGDRKFDLDGVSPLEFAGRISTPLLIAHGKDDATVPVWQTERLHQAMRKAGKPHEYVIYEGEGHGFGKPENAADFLKRMEAFLAKHNPAD